MNPRIWEKNRFQCIQTILRFLPTKLFHSTFGTTNLRSSIVDGLCFRFRLYTLVHPFWGWSLSQRGRTHDFWREVYFLLRFLCAKNITFCYLWTGDRMMSTTQRTRDSEWHRIALCSRTSRGTDSRNLAGYNIKTILSFLAALFRALNYFLSFGLDTPEVR